MKNRRSGFTLVEILVVLGIIALLAALLFPVFNKARETSRQTSCGSNLQQIYLAVTQYKKDEGDYPANLIDLLGDGAQFDNGTTTGGALDGKTAGYFKGGQDSLVCPDDDTQATVPRSSYGILTTTEPTLDVPLAPASAAAVTSFDTASPRPGDPAQFVWNYWGYRKDGYSYRSLADVTAACATLPCADLVTPANVYDKNSNPFKFSLSNRFAPPSTIITHCVYHRLPTASNINSPIELYADTANSSSARDVVLRLDGSAKSVDVTLWGPPAATPVTPTLWQKQTQ